MLMATKDSITDREIFSLPNNIVAEYDISFNDLQIDGPAKVYAIFIEQRRAHGIVILWCTEIILCMFLLSSEKGRRR